MSKTTNAKLYNFVTMLIFSLEEDLEKIKSKKCKDSLLLKKNITLILNKIVSIIIQLNKLEKEEENKENLLISADDEVIIESFLKKYNIK